MKKQILIPAFLAIALLFVSGCNNLFFDKPEITQAGSSQEMLLVSLSGANVNPSLGARTMLPLNPEFTRYALVFTDDSGVPLTGNNYREPYSFYNSSIQIQLPGDNDGIDYHIVAYGYSGDTVTAKSGCQDVKVVSAGGVTTFTPAKIDFILTPYMDTDNEVRGLLNYSLSWDGLSRMPSRAELLIETYDGDPISPALIPPELSASGPGTILLLQKSAAFVNLSGSLSLPPGEYRLTMTVIMDEGTEPVDRFDIAHVYSNLTTPAAFYYGGGDLLLSNTSPDSGASFITSFTFEETPTATTVIGAEPGTDGTRLIMIMVPPETTPAELKDGLTPRVVCADGSVITSPVPKTQPTQTTPKPDYGQGEIDFTNPTIWTAQAKNGAVQQYTVVVSKAPGAALDKSITYFFFDGFPNYPGIIDQDAVPLPIIDVTLPFYKPDTSTPTTKTGLTPIVSIIGQKVVHWNDPTPTPLPDSFNFDSPQTFRVYAADNTFQDYEVTVDIAANDEAKITGFAIDGYPGFAAITNPSFATIEDLGIGETPIGDYYPIHLELPYGVSLANLTPIVQYRGKTLDPGTGTAQNFGAPVYYTVTAEAGTQKTYEVRITNKAPNTDTGIFDFVITNVPAAKVVIGQKPRPDGKIPIVIQIPYDPTGTLEDNLIPAITLRSPDSSIKKVHLNLDYEAEAASGTPIRFTGQEATYRVTAQGGSATQDYAVVVSEGGQYYYVNGQTGRDDLPDYYTGESESRPFKTLAYAVYKASQHQTINHIFVSGELNDTTEGGAWEKGSVPISNIPNGFHSSGSDPDSDPYSVFNLRGTKGKTITITGVGNNATLRGTTGKRVLSITGDDEGGANLIFENITITGGRALTGNDQTHNGNGGGIYIGEASKVKFSGGAITGNTAAGSGGGVFVESENHATNYSEFTFMGGTISGNTASGSGKWANPNSSSDAMNHAGGGGVCVSGDALFWFASGIISNNTTAGSGGGVLVRGRLVDTDYDKSKGNYGFLMSGGNISGNKSNGGASPHGGGGVYVATGEFDMPGGNITSNTATRQGGGVFVHSGAVFSIWGDSSITGNTGVGSSKGICSRGVTEMLGNAQADTVYVWNPLAEDGGIDDDTFRLSGNARIGGIVLAHSAEYRNYIDIFGSIDGTDQISTIDLEGHLTPPSYAFVDTDINDWLNHTILNTSDAALAGRFTLGAFVGKGNISLKTNYTLSKQGKVGMLAVK
jgi:hypothetical protein